MSNVPFSPMSNIRLASSNASPQGLNIDEEITDDMIRDDQDLPEERFQDVISADFSDSYLKNQSPGADGYPQALVNYLDNDLELVSQQMMTGDDQNANPNFEMEFNFDGFSHQDLIERNLNMQCFLQTYTSKECIVCHPILQQIYLNAIQPEKAIDTQNISNKRYNLNQIIQDNLHKKYMTSKDFYNVKIINDIIYNEPTHIVAIFKDYLIYDDLSEFLKRSYDQNESVTRLPKITEFYEKYSKVFPNYVILPESKMMYKNIERKQKIIDDKQRCLQAKHQKKEEKIKRKMMKLNGGVMPISVDLENIDVDNYESSMSWRKNSLRFFNTQFMDSVLKQEKLPSCNTQHSSFIHQSQLLDQSNRKSANNNQSYRNNNNQSHIFKSFADLNLELLVQAFVTKDTQQQIITNESNVTATLDVTMPSFHQNEESEKFIKAMSQQQQKQKEIIMKQMQQRKVLQQQMLSNKQILQSQQFGQPMLTKASISQNSEKSQGLTSGIPQKFVFNTNGVNPYLKQQKYFEKIKTDSKRKSQGSSSLQNGSPIQQTTQHVPSPPKAQQFQQIYGTNDPIPKQAITMAKQVSGQRPTGDVQAPVKKKVKKQAAVNLNHQQQDFKIKHGFNIPPNVAFSLTQSHSGSLTQRENLQKKLINNLVNNQDHKIKNNFSPIDLQDQVNTKKPSIFSYNNQDVVIKPFNQGAGSQSARVLSNDGGVTKKKQKQNISSSKESKRQTYNTNGSPFQQNASNYQTDLIKSSLDYKSYTGNINIPSLKGSTQDKDLNQPGFQKVQSTKPSLVHRMDDLIRSDVIPSNRGRMPSPRDYLEESKQKDISNTLINQSNHMNSYQYQNNGQPQLSQKFMNKRNPSKNQQYQNANQLQNQHENYVQTSSTISHGNSGYNSQQNNNQNLQQTTNSSNQTNQLMKVMSLDIADISTNLNNNSRNFLARQQQQIQLQKQSRGMNPRQKSVPKNKSKQNQQQQNPQQNVVFIGENQNAQHYYASQIQNMNSSSQINPSSGRQSPIINRNNAASTHQLLDSNMIMANQYLIQQQVIGGGYSSVGNNRQYENSQLIQNNRQIIKKVLQSNKNTNSNTNLKSNSQNRVRESSPMDYQVQMLVNTTHQNPNQRYRDERQSLERVQKIGIPYQQVNLLVDSIEPSKRYSLKGNLTNKSPIIEAQPTRVRGHSNNPKKIIIGKKTNIFGANVVAQPSKVSGKQRYEQQHDVFDKDFADHNYKLILVGHQRVGKTSIINRYVNDMFNDNEQSSQCMQVQKKLIKIDRTDKWAQLHLWDTLGQEQYKSLSPLYFRKAVGVFLVFDCTSIDSFKACDGWFEQMSQTVDSRILIMLLGNKCDLPHREVPYNMAMEYARKKNFGYLEVSAKSGANIKNAFNCLVREIHRIRMQVKDDTSDNLDKIDGNLRQKGKSIKINSELHKEEDEMDDENLPDKKGRKGKKPKKEKCFKC